MRNLLKREQAPITEEAWAEIDEEAVRILKGNLSARGLVDFEGQKGLECASVNLGRVGSEGKNALVKGVEWNVRAVLPLTEVKVPFSLDMAELDNISKGASDADLDPVCEAARKLAMFEESALYFGFDEGCIRGIVSSSQNNPEKLPGSADSFTGAVESAIVAIEKNGIAGPYALVLGTSAYQKLAAGDNRGYPLKKRIEEMVRGGVKWSPAINGGALVSLRGGDYEMTVGQDIAVGYEGVSGNTIKLFMTESFTFRVLDERAAVALKPQGSRKK
ncbi:MAG: family 1 encapsulin nanocompartment shell protein [Verrucomicrobiota bacterium]